MTARFLQVLFLPATLFAAQATLSGGAVEGDVVNALTGRPVAGAHVMMWPVPSSGDTPSTTVITDAAGHFLFPTSPPRYLIDVREPGYLSARTPSEVWYGPNGTPRFALTPESVISGRLTSEDGLPVAGASLYTAQYSYADGDDRMIKGGSSGQTNERGEFRIRNQPAGRWSLQVFGLGSLQNDSRYAPQFYPGTIEPRVSGEIEVKTGEERSRIEFRLSTHPGAIISGGVEGSPVPESTVFLLTRKRREFIPSRESKVSPDGSFAISRVPPGTYILQARTGRYPPKPGDSFFEREIHVGDDDLRDLVLEMRTMEPMQLSGTVTLEDGSTRPLNVAILRRGEDTGSGTLSKADGSFVLEGLLPGHYFVMVQPDPRIRAFYIRRPTKEWMPIIILATLGGKDISKEGFDLDGTDPGPLNLVVRLPLPWPEIAPDARPYGSGPRRPPQR